MLMKCAKAIGKASLISGASIFAIVVVLAIITPAFTCGCGGRGGAKALKARSQLQQVHKALLMYAADSGDAYPPHAASLIIDEYFKPDLVADPTALAPNIRLGSFDLATYDGTAKTVAGLGLTIAQADVSPLYYRLGDFWLARLPRPTGDASIIAGWSAPDKNGVRNIVFDDNHSRATNAAEWPSLWQADAKARAALNLPVIQTPPP
jgi:hypothetical protein